MEEAQVYEFFNEKFKPIFADLIALLGEKPETILFEIEACFSHLAVAKTTSDVAISTRNFDKAYGHLVRASLDATKIIWYQYHEQSKVLAADTSIMNLGCNKNLTEIHRLYRECQALAKKARTNEVKLTGRNSETTLEEWYAAITKLEEFLDSFDQAKVTQIYSEREQNTQAIKNISKPKNLRDISISLICGAFITILFGYMTDSMRIKKPESLSKWLYTDNTDLKVNK